MRFSHASPQSDTHTRARAGASGKAAAQAGAPNRTRASLVKGSLWPVEGFRHRRRSETNLSVMARIQAEGKAARSLLSLLPISRLFKQIPPNCLSFRWNCFGNGLNLRLKLNVCFDILIRGRVRSCDASCFFTLPPNDRHDVELHPSPWLLCLLASPSPSATSFRPPHIYIKRFFCTLDNHVLTFVALLLACRNKMRLLRKCFRSSRLFGRSEQRPSFPSLGFLSLSASLVTAGVCVAGS